MLAHKSLERELRRTDVESSRTIGEKLETILAFGVLVFVDAAMNLAGFHRFYQLVRGIPTNNRLFKRVRSINRILSAVDRAATIYFKRAWCLQRSGTVICLLRLSGIPAELVIGVRRMPFYAHAWVELHGRVLNDSPVVQNNYTVLERC